jgi:predicted enzyme related to lactoylglutathione lyase
VAPEALVGVRRRVYRPRRQAQDGPEATEMSGRVVHFEIPFDDGDRARSFYKEIFDWQLDQMPEMGGYTLVTTGPSGDQGPTEPGFINGGMLSREQGATSGPVIVVDVASIDASLERIGSLGGTVVAPKTPVGDMGFAAYFTDPEGNVVGLWETTRS